jgi:hypothetical protein
MKKIAIITFIAALVTASPLFSMGFGFYGTGGLGRVDMLTINSDGDYRVNYSVNNTFYGGGILFDSGSTGEGFHNRLSIGAETNSTFDGRYEYRRMMRIGLNNLFAFEIVNKGPVRFFIGPLLGINVITGLAPTTRNEEWGPNRLKYSLSALAASGDPAFATYGLYYIYMDHIYEQKLGAFIPVGISLGTNIMLGKSAALTIEAGFRCGLYIFRKTGFNYEGYLNGGFIFGAI